MTSLIAARPFFDEDDWWAVRALLIELGPLGPQGAVWEIRRWDGRRFYREDPWERSILERCRLWVEGDGRLVGAAHSEGSGPDIHLQVHPDHREFEGEMLDWALENLAAVRDGTRRLDHMAYDDDTHRIGLLEERGFLRLDEQEVTRRQTLLDVAISPPDIADGYTLRATQDGYSEFQRMADLLNAAFGRTIHNAGEYGSFSERSPSFRHDLNLVAQAPDGSFAAHVGFTLDEANRRGIVEPVCTHPDHRRHGLAQALIQEGLRRLQALDAEVATVDTGDDEGANRFYDAAGFGEPRWGHTWRWDAG